MKSSRICILGAGSWGTTLAIMLGRRGQNVALWEFRPDAARRVQEERINREFLPGHPLPDSVAVTGDIAAALDGATLALLTLPSHTLRSVAGRLPRMPDCVLASSTKGIEENTLMRMSEVLADVWKSGYDPSRFVCLSGPSHAEEVVIGMPTTVVAASCDIKAAEFVQGIMSGERFRVYTHDDLTGVELGGSLKNVIAIAAGIAAGLKFGDNAMGALVTRGLAEIARLGTALGGRPATFAGLSGMGDLVTTCFSRHSRNRHVGEEIGKGRKLPEILGEMVMVAEGVRTTNSAYELAKREGIEMPITRQVHRILFEGADPLNSTVELMTRRLKGED